jgi:hypothetical protein
MTAEEGLAADSGFWKELSHIHKQNVQKFEEKMVKQKLAVEKLNKRFPDNYWTRQGPGNLKAQRLDDIYRVFVDKPGTAKPEVLHIFSKSPPPSKLSRLMRFGMKAGESFLNHPFGRVTVAVDITCLELKIGLGWGPKYGNPALNAHWARVKARMAKEKAAEDAYKKQRKQQEWEWEQQEKMARLQENIARLKGGARNIWNVFPNIWRGIHRQTFAKWWALGEWVYKAR